eukprot:CAMPEP_0174252770 /NCGR_PEP_ID=MMETSP0439-20130205/2144_1 /TAXON_ID=0 /ORGANISM="Stereomyxa ramosa, Strain Chinc5" /LENGTH=282 /DNA_ID=CAMNT_0015333393 /DNA_START=139 /DNA_END=983 /DNA_ORIENTATION=+
MPKLLLFHKRPVGEVLLEFYAKYGNAFKVWIGTKQVVIVSDVELIEHILKNNNVYEKQTTSTVAPKVANFLSQNLVFVRGEAWKRQRTAMNPAFKYKKIKSFTPLIINTAQVLLSQFTEHCGEELEPYNFLQRMTLDVLGKAAFSYDFNTLQCEDGKYNKAYHGIVANMTSASRFLFPKLNSYTILPSTKKLYDNIDAINELCDKLINDSKQSTESEDLDLLGAMLRSHADNTLSEQEIKNNLFIFFLAGHETTASTLSFAMAILAQHPEEQEKLYQEVMEV